MKGLRAGGKALVIKAYIDQSIVGKVVHIVELVPQGGSYKSPSGGELHYVDEDTGDVWICTGDVICYGLDGNILAFGHSIFGPEQLMPLDDPDGDIIEKEKDLILGVNSNAEIY